MESSLAVWFKSLYTVLIGDNARKYLSLLPNGNSGVASEGTDANNNDTSPSAKGHREAGQLVMSSTSHSVTMDPPVLQHSAMHTEPNIPDAITTTHQTETSSHNGQLNQLCCDTISYSQLSNSTTNSLDVGFKVKSGHKIKSNKVVEAIIAAIKEPLELRFDPHIIEKRHNFPINSFMTVCTKKSTISGFSNIEKTENDGIIRYLGRKRFSIDCIVAIRNLRCHTDYVIKLGHRWHKRILMRNKSFSLRMDKCLIYIEIVVNTETQSIRVERFSPISQENVRCQTKAFSTMSCSHLFSNLLQRYFERLFAANILKLESVARRHLSKGSLLDYNHVVSNTSLQALLDCLPQPSLLSPNQ